MKLKHALIQAACAAVAFSATAAMAQNVVGGGASLPEFLYKAEITAFAPNYAPYASTGSGAGKTALLTNAPAAFNAVTGRTDTVVHYAGSDSILSPSEISTYNANRAATEGAAIQMPSVATAVGIAFKAAPSNITLTTDQLCGVFSGKITDWSAISGISGPIRVVYRSDSSGTTEIFTRHLSAVCSVASGNSNVNFTTTTTFANNFPSGVPSNFVGAALSAGVRDSIDVGNSIGYLSPDYINTTLAPASTAATKSLKAAFLRNKNITTGTATFQPTAAATTTALANLTISGTLSDQNSWAPLAADPAAGYPISGFTYLDHVQCYSNATVKTDVLAFLNKHYDYADTAQVNRIQGNGFALLPSAIVTKIKDEFLTGTANNLNIGNAVACSGKAGR